jgi:multidrug efflux system outer membrane protein
MKAAKLFLPSLLVLALAACAVGPDYKKPETAAANIQAATQRAYDRSHTETIWWQQFDDPTLNKLVAESLQGNRELRVAFARLKASRAIRDDISNDAMPIVTSRASSQVGRGQVPGQTEQRVNQERYDLGLDMAWELDLFGRIQRELEASDADQQAAEANLYQLQVTMIAELVDAYGQLRGAQLRENIARDNLKNQQESRRVTAQLRDEGVGNELDVVRSDARLAAVEATIPQLQAEQVRERNRIATLLGERPDAMTVTLAPAKLPAISKALPIGDPTKLLENRPDVRSADRRADRRPVPAGQPQRFPWLHRQPWFADRFRRGPGLGPRPEHHLGGV